MYSNVYSKVLKYAASEDSRNLLKEATAYNKRKDSTIHGAIADSLDETNESPRLAKLIRNHYGLSGYQPIESPQFGLTQKPYGGNSPAGSFPIAEDNNFSYHLGYSRRAPDEDGYYTIHAESKLPETKHMTYSFYHPESEGDEIVKMFPDAKRLVEDRSYFWPATNRETWN